MVSISLGKPFIAETADTDKTDDTDVEDSEGKTSPAESRDKSPTPVLDDIEEDGAPQEWQKWHGVPEWQQERKDKLAVLEGTVMEHARNAASQVDADNLRFKELEHLIPTKGPLQQLQQLEADVALLENRVERDFSTTTQSIRSTAAAAAHDSRWFRTDFSECIRFPKPLRRRWLCNCQH